METIGIRVYIGIIGSILGNYQVLYEDESPPSTPKNRRYSIPQSEQ